MTKSDQSLALGVFVRIYSDTNCFVKNFDEFYAFFFC